MEPNQQSRCDIVEQYQITKNMEDEHQNINNIVIVMVGLPGRGKTYIANRLCRWLKWKNINTKIFSAGSYRRKLFAKEEMDYRWFDPSNKKNVEKREQIIDIVYHDIISWLRDRGKIALLDATNSTTIRRQKLKELFVDYRLLFVETICDIEDVIARNFFDAKIGNEDYKNKDADVSKIDFYNRIREYKKTYSKLDKYRDYDTSFVQLYNLGKQILLNNIRDQLFQKISFFLMNLNPATPNIYMTRHGQSEGQLKQIIGGDSDLTVDGVKFSHNLKQFIDEKLHNYSKINVMCSTLKRSVQTGSVFQNNDKYCVSQWKSLDEINGGLFEEYSYDHVKNKYSDIFEQRMINKYISSWPGGETYRNMIDRLENVFLELEYATEPIVIIAHQAVCRGLYAYMMNMKPEECTTIEIPSHTVFEFHTKNNKNIVKTYDIDQIYKNNIE